MGKTFFNFLGIITVITLFSGCVVIINAGEPTKEEKMLMDIQTQASQEIAEINQKIQAGGFSVEQLQELVLHRPEHLGDARAGVGGACAEGG